MSFSLFTPDSIFVNLFFCENSCTYRFISNFNQWGKICRITSQLSIDGHRVIIYHSPTNDA